MKKKTQIKSFDSENDGPFGDVLTSRPKPRGSVVGVLGLGYFEYWRMYPALEAQVKRDLQGAVARLKKALPGASVVYPGMVDTLDRAQAAGEAFQKANVEILIVVAGTYLPDFITLHAINACTFRPLVVLFDTQTGNDVNPKDTYIATMRNSALIAMTQLSGSFRKMKLDYRVVVGEVADPGPYRRIAHIVEVHAAVRRLRGATFGLLGHVFRGMYDLEFDRAKVKGFLGPEVMTIQADHLIELWKQVPAADAHRCAQALLARFPSRNVTPEDAEKSVRLGLAMRALVRKFNLDGLCFLGQHYLEKMTGAPARMGASLLMEEDGLPVACEGDIGGLVMMELMRLFTGSMPLQAEWGQFDMKNNVLFMLGHGIGVPAMAAADKRITLTGSPEEWGFSGGGLNYELILRPGPVTLGHVLNCGEAYRMLVCKGEAIEFPTLPCNELHAMVRLEKPVKEFLEELIANGVAHHAVIVHGECTEQLKLAAQMMRLEVLEI